MPIENPVLLHTIVNDGDKDMITITLATAAEFSAMMQQLTTLVAKNPNVIFNASASSGSYSVLIHEDTLKLLLNLTQKNTSNFPVSYARAWTEDDILLEVEKDFKSRNL